MFTMKKDTSWHESAEWYKALLAAGQGTYQTDILLPNLMRLVGPKAGLKILDLGCGTGFFARAFANAGAEVTGLDNGADMIRLAQEESRDIKYYHGSADNLKQFADASFDAVTIVLALQNMENLSGVINECARVLKVGGSVYLVLNHPAFRVPKNSGWEWNRDRSVQYRRIDTYLSESKQSIQMHPGAAPDAYTVSFHRPLQAYVKILGKANFGVTRLEEWISNRPGPKGRTFAALEQSRKEIPLFLFLEARLLA